MHTIKPLVLRVAMRSGEWHMAYVGLFHILNHRGYEGDNPPHFSSFVHLNFDATLAWWFASPLRPCRMWKNSTLLNQDASSLILVTIRARELAPFVHELD